MFRQHAERSCSLSLLKRMLHQAVFTRVVTQHHPAAARIHCGGGPRKKMPPVLPLSIFPHPPRPEKFFLGVQAPPSPLLFGPFHTRFPTRGVPFQARSLTPPC